MNFVYNNYVYDNNFLLKLTDNLNDIHAYHYNKFVNHKFGDYTIIDTLHALDRNVPYDKNCTKEIGNKILSLDDQKSLMVEFFSRLGLGEKVKSILDGTHPDYITDISPNAPNQVGHSGYNDYLTYEVKAIPTIEGCWLLAHEMGHALSNHHAKAMTLAKATNIAEKNFGRDSDEFKSQRQVFRDYSDNRPRNTIDCIGEVESHITEKLFMLFLVEKGLITKEDFKSYLTSMTNSLRHNATLMIEENEIISKLNNPVTEQDCLNLYNKFKSTNHLHPLLDRIKKMAERKDNPDPKERRLHSKHVFRYIVGEIVSTMWLKNYLEVDKKQQNIMLKRFVNYLSKTDKANLENVCNLALGNGETINSTVTDYLNFISTQQFSL